MHRIVVRSAKNPVTAASRFAETDGSQAGTPVSSVTGSYATVGETHGAGYRLDFGYDYLA